MLNGKTILITGASSGIGAEVAVQCSKAGAEVIITARNEKRLQRTAELCPNDTTVIVADLTDFEQLKNLVNQLPPLDGLIECAGIVKMLPLTFATTSVFEEIYKTNLFAPIELLRLIVRGKKYRPGMSVTAISSIAGTSDFVPGNSIYGSGKAALKSLFKYAALELASKKIRVNTVSPGMIMTAMHTNGGISEEEITRTIQRIPLKEWGSPIDIAMCCVFLQSDNSRYITGTDIIIDGGLTI